MQPRRVELSSCRRMTTADELRTAFRECVDQQLEGLMIKDVNAPYAFADRKAWLKMKQDYLKDEAERSAAGLKMVDSVDLLVVGAFLGTGKKAAMLSSFLMGCWDEEAGTSAAPRTLVGPRPLLIRPASASLL